MAGSIGVGMYDVALAGGVEHMGHHPIGANADPNPRFVAEKMVDPGALNMGVTAERIFDRFPHLTKERSDRYGMLSQHKAQAAYDAGKIQPDLVLGRHQGRRRRVGSGDRGRGPPPADDDGGPRGAQDALPSARPRDRRYVLAAHGRRDDVAARPAAAPVKELGLAPEDEARLVRVRGRAAGDHGHRARSRRPRRRSSKAGLTIDDIGLFELNEAFAIQVISLLDHFGIADDDPRVNQWGGAIALGHPLAASGVRLMIQLGGAVRRAP